MTVLVRWCVFLLAVLALELAPIPQARSLELPAIFADHMVLQRDMPVPVWGKAYPGTLLEIQWNGEAVGRAVANVVGDWRADLPAMSDRTDTGVLTIVT